MPSFCPLAQARVLIPLSPIYFLLHVLLFHNRPPAQWASACLHNV